LIPAEPEEVRGMKDDVMAGNTGPLFLTRDFRRVPGLKDGRERAVENTLPNRLFTYNRTILQLSRLSGSSFHGRLHRGTLPLTR
jgi:hypothetical protein